MSLTLEPVLHLLISLDSPETHNPGAAVLCRLPNAWLLLMPELVIATEPISFRMILERLFRSWHDLTVHTIAMLISPFFPHAACLHGPFVSPLVRVLHIPASRSWTTSAWPLKTSSLSGRCVSISARPCSCQAVMTANLLTSPTYWAGEREAVSMSFPTVVMSPFSAQYFALLICFITPSHDPGKARPGVMLNVLQYVLPKCCSAVLLVFACV